MLCSDVHRDVGVCMCSVDQAEARPAIPYQRKYSHCYHTWLGCPHWPFFYLSKMSWIPGLITSALPTPFHCFIAILLHTDDIKYCRGLAICGAFLTVYNLKECIQCFCGSTASVSKMGNLKQLRHKGK